MESKIAEAKGRMLRLPKVEIGFYPAPFHRLPALSAKLGVNIYLKREDMSGFSPFGGNKIRKLEYLMGDALEKGSEYAITFGATQSNHVMQTVTACRKCGVKPIVFLNSVVEPDKAGLRANLLLDAILGAEVHIVATKEEAEQASKERVEALERTGHPCYVIPPGGSNPVGSAGFADCFIEMAEQMEKRNVEAEYLFHANGSGGTLAGLIAGKKMLDSPIEIVPIAVGPKVEAYIPQEVDLLRQTLGRIGIEKPVSADDVHIEWGYYGAGYEIPSEGATDAIKLLAEMEGIFLDPVYTGKAFHGMLDFIRSGKIKQGSSVVFLHTGGTIALFSEKEIVGNLV